MKRFLVQVFFPTGKTVNAPDFEMLHSDYLNLTMKDWFARLNRHLEAPVLSLEHHQMSVGGIIDSAGDTKLSEMPLNFTEQYTGKPVIRLVPREVAAFYIEQAA